MRIFFLGERQKPIYPGVRLRIGRHPVHALLINVGMVLGLVPVIGIPLPFMSYGGSSFMAFSIMSAVLLRLDAERFSVLR